MDDVPDQGFPAALTSQLSARFLGRPLHFFDSIDSTNTYASCLARDGAAEGTAVIADTQTGGKGRLGRRWVSPSRVNLYLSVILRPSKSAGSAPQLSLLAAVAVAETIAQHIQPSPAIKWPNDVLVSGKKVCGILTEMQTKVRGLQAVILGIGVNINAPLSAFPEELQAKATSLLVVSGRLIDRVAFTAHLLTRLEKLYVLWLEEGFAAVQSAWEGYAANLLGKSIVIAAPEGTISGTALGIDHDGALLVRLVQEEQTGQPGAIRRVLAGDVTVVGGYRKNDGMN